MIDNEKASEKNEKPADEVLEDEALDEVSGGLTYAEIRARNREIAIKRAQMSGGGGSVNMGRRPR